MRCNYYPPWWDKTVTLYNKVTTGGKISYYRHILKKCFVGRETNGKSDGGNEGTDGAVTVRIRANDKYLAPQGYANSGAAVQASHFTVTPGDVILLGAVKDEMADEPGKRPHDLLAKYDGFFVSGYKDNSDAPPKHYKVVTK